MAATIVVGKGAHGVVTDPKSTFIYVTNMFDNTVSVINNRENRVISTVPVGETPNGITYKDSNLREDYVPSGAAVRLSYSSKCSHSNFARSMSPLNRSVPRRLAR